MGPSTSSSQLYLPAGGCLEEREKKSPNHQNMVISLLSTDPCRSSASFWEGEKKEEKKLGFGTQEIKKC